MPDPAAGPEAAPPHRQIECLEEALGYTKLAQSLLSVAADLALPGWYLGAGAVAQTVWNIRHGFEAAAGIKDYDLVYFDAGDLGAETPKLIEREVAQRLRVPGLVLDVQNEARVHLWYGERFGTELPPFGSTEEAIAT